MSLYDIAIIVRQTGISVAVLLHHLMSSLSSTISNLLLCKILLSLLHRLFFLLLHFEHLLLIHKVPHRAMATLILGMRWSYHRFMRVFPQPSSETGNIIHKFLFLHVLIAKCIWRLGDAPKSITNVANLAVVLFWVII